ncbi:MAG: phosphoribosyltransferase [Crenarchaeota archaeon]|nr:MAG: phosphoribosyltransferase [Thermoproteota archaeon]RDJ34566.1 MAG: phosphoribosyltransferase [Thermoproteota archaeon]RDJ35914.1 MAG: phosphoribosyltransferase [Thermoproteota archaeon]RDJ38491.1 MAG: phosphoribosyltransferase [Thermoproteota archaeon]
MIQKKNVTWEDIESYCSMLENSIKNLGISFQSISTISRGGLVPARLLADRLGIKKILVDGNVIPRDSLFVDDIYDTGNTFEKISPKAEDLEGMIYATIFARKGKKLPKQLIYAKMTEGDEYIVFPWDRFEHK